MLDLSLNSDFDVHLNDRNGLATVSERDEFEQSLVIALTDYMHNSAIGEFDPETVREKLRLIASRVARRSNRINSVERVEVAPSEDAPNTYEVRIVYGSDALSTLTISE